MTGRLYLLAPMLLIVGCEVGDEAENAPPPVSAVDDVQSDGAPSATDSATTTDGTRRETIGGMSFEIPQSWRRQESSMIDAKFLIDGEAGSMYLTLTGMRGGLNQNLDRFRGQIIQATRSVDAETIQVDGRTAPWIDRTGEFQGSGGPPQSTPGERFLDYRLLATGIALSDTDFYIRLVGPAASVEAFEPKFRALIASARVK